MNIKKDYAFDVLSTRYELIDTVIGGFRKDDSKLIAFYLPQYHRIPENSEWWGPGFTEWTNVVKGHPNFDGHYQPHQPRDLGFYDLSNVEVMREQAEMARDYGVYGFCFYHYWFSGRRVLEKPVDNFIKSDIDMNFCLCWANENWTRTWSGDTESVLLGQSYTDEDDHSFIESLALYLTDSRYILVDGKPLILVYRANQIPDAKRSFAIWRKKALGLGFPGLHIAVVDFYDISSPAEVDADALVEFPPLKFNGPQSRPENPPRITNPDFAGGLVDYHKVIAQSAGRAPESYRLYRGIMPSWDNTARRQDTGTIVLNSNPVLYAEWLKYIRAYTRQYHQKSDNFIFINAWNEWGEGCHLEPDQKWEMQYLEATLRSAYYEDADYDLAEVRSKLYTALAKSLSPGEHDSAEAVEKRRDVEQKLRAYKPVGHVSNKIAFYALQWPLIYRALRLFYRAYRKLVG